MPAARPRGRRQPPAEPQQSTAVAVVEPPAQEKAIVTIKRELEARETDLLAVLPPGMAVERFMRVSLIAISKNPDLLSCTPGSIIRSIVEAAEVGLEPTGSLNRAWLVPFKNPDTGKKEAQLMIGYQGYGDLMRDSGKVRRITVECVYEGDHFKVVKGSEEPRIEHEPAFATEDPAKITYVYGVAWFADGGTQQEVMSHSQVELIRAKSRQRNGPTWTQNWPQMARKTLIRRLANYVPLTARAIAAIARDDEREFGAAPPAATVSRTAQVRDRVLSRGKKAEPKAVAPVSDEQAASEAPGGPETVETAPDANITPSASAGQQTEPTDPVAQGDGQAVCGATSDPKLGAVETCTLPPDHLAVKGSAQRHQSPAGSVWPA